MTDETAFSLRYREILRRRIVATEALITQAQELADDIDTVLEQETDSDTGGNAIDIRAMLVVDLDEMRRELRGIRRQDELLSRLSRPAPSDGLLGTDTETNR